MGVALSLQGVLNLAQKRVAHVLLLVIAAKVETFDRVRQNCGAVEFVPLC